jgi:hypothetical protein
VVSFGTLAMTRVLLHVIDSMLESMPRVVVVVVMMVAWWSFLL